MLSLVLFFRDPSKGNGCEKQGACRKSSPKLWGQYSPFFSVPSDISPAVPLVCEITHVSLLARHGARYPTEHKSILYSDLIKRIHGDVSEYGAGLEFLQDYHYNLGADQLTFYGEQQLVNMGHDFYQRYQALSDTEDPFIRAAGSERVIASAEKFIEGLYKDTGRDKDAAVEGILVVPEEDGYNNTLNHGNCPYFEQGPSSELSHEKQEVWKQIFVPPIRDRLNAKMPGANLSLDETIFMMDMCPFSTVADYHDEKSRFCWLFSEDEWRGYDYFETLDKWYGYGTGNPLGATQGVGYVNELIARLTGKPVDDDTSTNSTLDGSAETFPLDRKLYADFSHDNTMSSIYAALGLYNETGVMPVNHRLPPMETRGFSAAWTVPFAARMSVEKMRCGAASDEEEELVWVLVNDRVVPLTHCAADKLGRCSLGDFVEGLSFARSGGLWDQCFRDT